jgi:hypothetical protein
MSMNQEAKKKPSAKEGLKRRGKMTHEYFLGLPYIDK